jgi:probable lipoprotein NlpC
MSRHFFEGIKYVVFFSILVSIQGCAVGKKSKQRKQKIDQVITAARAYTGTPYRFGGTTRAGMDCSGLLVLSFREAGIDLPRTSKAQSKIGKGVSLYEVQPGDLVFFAAGKRRREITHVGLVTQIRSKEDVQFIHASTKLGVMETNLFSEYYKKIFIRARRPDYH